MAITATIQGGAIQLSGNPVRISCSGASIPENASDYMILLKIINTDGKLYGAPFVDSIAPDDSGEAEFDISGYVDQPVEAVFQWPIPVVPTYPYEIYPTQAFNIKVQPGERFINAAGFLEENWFSESAEFQILKGGLSPRQVAYMNDQGYTFYQKYIQAGKFLTARPNGDYVHPYQPVKLWFMPASSSTKQIKIKMYYSDGSDDTYNQAILLNTDNLYEIDCNPYYLNYNPVLEGKVLTHFDVYIDGASETRRFTIDWTPCERPVYLMFANTFGGVDDVYFKGNIKDMFSAEGEISYRPPRSSDTVYTPTLLSLDKVGQNKWSINTGWKPLTTIQYYRDLLVAKQAWYLYTNLDQTSVNIIPITDIKAGEVLLDRKKRMFSLQVDFSEAHQSKHSFDNRVF